MSKPSLLVFSPHLDDAILSCGGLIHRWQSLGLSVTVLTIFAGSPPGNLSDFAQWIHKVWKLPFDAPSQRREEDIKATKLLGACAIHLEFLDCIYRENPITKKALYTKAEDVFAGDYGHESALVSQIADSIVPILNQAQFCFFLAPLGIGQHIDHIITHQVVDQVIRQSRKNYLVYYEDFPYVTKHYVANEQGSPLLSKLFDYVIIPLTEEDLQIKERAIQQYASQLQDVAGDLGILIPLIKEYASAVMNKERGIYGERYWSPLKATLNQFSIASRKE